MKTLKKIGFYLVMTIGVLFMGYAYQSSWGIWNVPGALVSGVISLTEEVSNPLEENSCLSCLTENNPTSCVTPCLESILKPKLFPRYYTYIKCDLN